MNLEFQHLLPENFAPQSRVWIYQSSRLFLLSEVLDIENSINDFCNEWRTHGAEVKAYGNLFFGQFLMLMADERSAQVSGCSTDSSVRFVKDLEEKFSVDFFNRSNLAFVIKEKIQMLPLSQLQYAFDNQFITQESLFFNNTVQTKEQLQNEWIVPIKNSWLSKKLKIAAE